MHRLRAAGKPPRPLYAYKDSRPSKKARKRGSDGPMIKFVIPKFRDDDERGPGMGGHFHFDKGGPGGGGGFGLVA